MNLFSARYALRSLRHVPLGLFTAVFIGLFIHSFLDALNGNFDKWALSDWLINYEGGFVRRGFGGSLFHFFWVNFAIDVERHIIFLSYFSYLLISLYYVSAVIRSSSYLNGLVMAIWLFLPSLVLFALLDHSAIGRKEILFYIPLLVNLYLFNRNNLIRMTARNITEPLKNHSIKVYGFQVFFIFNLIAIPIVLIHESFLFLSLPLNFIVSLTILSKVLKMRIALVFTSLLYLPTAIVAGICFIYRGSTDIAKKICASWVASGMVDCDPDLPGAIDGLSWSFSKAVSLPYAVLTSDGGLVALHWFILFAVNLLLICFAASKLIDRYLNLHYYRCGNPSGIVQRTLFKYLTLPIVASLPLYVVGWDWGRWFSVALTSFSICLLTCPELALLEAGGGCRADRKLKRGNINIKGANPIQNNPMKTANARLHPIVWMLTAYTVMFTTLPHCCLEISDLYKGLVYKLFQLVF